MTEKPAAGEELLLDVRDLAVSVPVGREQRPLVTDVSFGLPVGGSLGLVGESGSGKSMTARAILRLLQRDAKVSGSVRFEGEDVYGMSKSRLRAWHAREVGMIYQDPRAHINPLRTIGDFLTEGLRQSGVSTSDAYEQAEALLKRVGVGNADVRIRQFPHQLSGGLLQRVMIASVLLMKPKLVIADEPTTALDVTIQEAVMVILDEMRRAEGVSLLMVTHDLDLAAAVTDRLAVVYAGRVVELGASATMHEDGIHPYARGLLASRPSTSCKERLKVIPGRPVAAFEAPSGCVFADRCDLVEDVCRTDRPSLREVATHRVACHRADEIVADRAPVVGGRA
ncbi:ABC transporter ATP-binding protein [Streptomyces phaeolivaceus]|uniref:ABC transporter ATP-binding protein n=1 Tax=Streptomyces phaeolivaceus TaxID=2653200 RepID=A0A5P8KF39_9ACTN|nr:ABC transporter ATP-binding protein [Streptomyces phaeolivaceus]QFR01631.1 ABC transporter ATP-binding protein [Streptomyces phaeolivaceus]